MFGHDNTISEHQNIRHKTFDFLMNLTLELEGKRIESKHRIHVSITDLIDFIDELEKCNEYNKQLGGVKHAKSMKCLESIVKRLTTGKVCDKIEVNDLLGRWMKDNVDLEHCQRPIKLY